jgi:hypothetical protein
MDARESTDVPRAHPDVVRRIELVMGARTRSPVEGWNF